MADSFKATKKEQSFVTSLFLLSRILMLRLGTQKLAVALKRLWPHLLAELVSVFESGGPLTAKGMGTSTTSNADANQVSYKLKREAIKVVELMSQLNIDEFQMNQWMFMFDGFGIQYHNEDDLQQDLGDLGGY